MTYNRHDSIISNFSKDQSELEVKMHIIVIKPLRQHKGQVGECKNILNSYMTYVYIGLI